MDHPYLVLQRRLADPANWDVDRCGRQTIALEHHRVTLHRVGRGWTWSYERFDEPGFIRRGAVVADIPAAWFHMVHEFWQDLVDGGTKREMVFRGLAATAAKRRRSKWAQTTSAGCPAAPMMALNGTISASLGIATVPLSAAVRTPSAGREPLR